MSWSVVSIGKSQAVKAEISRQFSIASPCLEPEESVRQAAAKAIDAALAAFDGANAVRVAANGSQGYKDWDNKTGVFNSLNIVIEPMYGFVE